LIPTVARLFVGSSVSYLEPHSTQYSRIHTRDKVLTPFGSRSSSGDRTVLGDVDTSLIAIQNSNEIQPLSSLTELAVQSAQFPDAPPEATSSLPTDAPPTSVASLRTRRQNPAVVENFENFGAKKAVESSSSSVNAVYSPKGPATAPKLVMWSATESLQPAQPLNQPPSFESSEQLISARQTRPFSPADRGTEPPSVADRRPWSPPQLVADRQPPSQTGMSSVQLGAGSQHPSVPQFTHGPRLPGPPPPNPPVPTGPVRVPYIPTPRSSSAGASPRILPPSPLDPRPPSAISIPVSHYATNTPVTTASQSVDSRPFSPTNRPPGESSASQLPGYRKVAAPNPHAINSQQQHQNRANDPSLIPQSNGFSPSEGRVIQGQQSSDAYRPFSPVDVVSPNKAAYLPNFQQSKSSTVSAGVNEQLQSPRTGQVPSMTYQQIDKQVMSPSGQSRPFSPQSGQVQFTNYQQSQISSISEHPQSRPFSPNASLVPFVNYQQTSTRPFSPSASQAPSMNYQPHTVNYEQPRTSSMSEKPQTRPFSPGAIEPINYQSNPANSQQHGASTLPDSAQSRPFSPKAGQARAMNHHSRQQNWQQTETSYTSDPSHTRPFSPQLSSANYQSRPVNYHQPDAFALSGQPQAEPFGPQVGQVPAQTRPFSPRTTQSSAANYQNRQEQAGSSSLSDAVGNRPFSPNTGQVPPANYQPSPAKYHQSKSTVSEPHQTRPFSPESNNQSRPKQAGSFAVSDASRKRPFSPNTSQPSPVNYHQPATSPVPEQPQTQPFSPRGSVRQQVLRFSAPSGGNQAANNYPPRQQQQQQQQQQQYSPRPKAPVVTTRGTDIRRTDGTVYTTQGGPLGPRGRVQSPPANVTVNRDHMQIMASPARTDVSSARQLSTAQRPFSPGVSLVAPPIRAHHQRSASSEPAVWTHSAVDPRRPFSPPASPASYGPLPASRIAGSVAKFHEIVFGQKYFMKYFFFNFTMF